LTAPAPAPAPAAAPRDAATCVLDAKAELAECPLWVPSDAALWWIDIHAGRLHRFDPADGSDRAVELGEPIGSFAPRLRDGALAGFVAALKSGFWLLDAQGGRERRLAALPEARPWHRMNDGRCDRQGRFWAGGIDESHRRRDARLFRVAHDGTLDVRLENLHISNGLAFSPDGRTLYHADTPTRVVHAYDHDPDTGALTAKRVFHRFERPGDHPDGATVDAEGCYWVALWGAGAVARLSPDGREIARLALPAPHATMPAFGGPDLRTLYVTTARQELSGEALERWPRSGGIFAFRVDAPGLPETPFGG
jgi:sugar lactone lactonase YvrE